MGEGQLLLEGRQAYKRRGETRLFGEVVRHKGDSDRSKHRVKVAEGRNVRLACAMALDIDAKKDERQRYSTASRRAVRRVLLPRVRGIARCGESHEARY